MVTQRTMIQADTMFYVSSDPAIGNDINDGLTPSTPKRTLQAMLDTWHRQYDQAGYQVQFQLLDSPFTYAGFSCRGGHVGHYGTPVLPPSLQIVGNPSNHALTHIRGIGMSAAEQLVWGSLHFDHVMLSSDTYYGVASRLTGSEMVLHNMTFGDCGRSAIYAECNANILMGQDIAVVGDCPEFIYANKHANIEMIGALTITAHGSRKFSDFFVGAARRAVLDISSVNFALAPGASVANVGQRWACLRGDIETGGRNPDAILNGFGLPGSIRSAVGAFAG